MVAVNLDTDGPFDELCPELPLVLNPGETADCDVSFLGTGTAGLAEGVLSATTDLDETVQVQVRAHVAHPPGVGVALRHGASTPVPVVETASLPDVFLGHQKTSYLIVTNSGRQSTAGGPHFVFEQSFEQVQLWRHAHVSHPPATCWRHVRCGGPQPPGTPDAGPTVAASLTVPLIYEGIALNVDSAEQLVADTATLTLESSDPAQGAANIQLQAITVDPQPGQRSDRLPFNLGPHPNTAHPNPDRHQRGVRPPLDRRRRLARGLAVLPHPARRPLRAHRASRKPEP